MKWKTLKSNIIMRPSHRQEDPSGFSPQWRHRVRALASLPAVTTSHFTYTHSILCSSSSHSTLNTYKYVYPQHEDNYKSENYTQEGLGDKSSYLVDSVRIGGQSIWLPSGLYGKQKRTNLQRSELFLQCPDFLQRAKREINLTKLEILHLPLTFRHYKPP